MLNKNDIIEIKCNEVSYDGFGKGLFNGQLVLVKDLLNGEIAKVKIVAIKTKVVFATIIDIIESSSSRISPPCNVYYKCGGCQYQHISYDTQCEIKQQRVQDCFSQIAGMKVDVLPIIKATELFHYRNKVQIPVQYKERFMMGFYRQRSNDIVEFDECLVQSNVSNKITHKLKELIVKYHFETDIRHILIKHALINNEVMIVLVSRNKDLCNIGDFINEIIEEYHIVKSIILNYNKRNDNVILDSEELLLYGESHISEKLNDYTFNISSKSFYQINPYQTIKLYDLVLDYLCLNGSELVIDLYSGTGTIGIYLAKHAKKVIGIEIVEEAVNNAKENAKKNNIDNIEFRCKDATMAIKELVDEYKVIDALVVDPPRKGLTSQGIEHIIKAAPKILIYVSCDPATLARDISLLKDHFTVDLIQPIDMFPQTNHVESIVKLVRNR